LLILEGSATRVEHILNTKKTTDSAGKPVDEQLVKKSDGEGIEKEVSGVVEEVDKEVSKIITELEQEDKKQEKDQKETMEEMYDKTFTEISEGAVIEGEVVRVDNEGVFVSVGYKTDGFIPKDQISYRPFNTPEEVVKVGESVSVYVLGVEDEEGKLILSKKRADLEDAWRRVTQAFENQTVITATVVEQVKGGLIVDLGLRGFVPASQIRLKPVRNLEDFVGEPLRLKVLELDRSRRKVVLSQKKVLQEEGVNRKEKTLNELKEGQIRKGSVARVTNFGVFVNLGGVDGLVHISELSWSRVKHPSEVVNVGDDVEIMILAINKKKERISLSLKQAQPDPWQIRIQDYHMGDILEGEITKIAKNYIFIQLEPGIEGLVPLFEVTEDRNAKLSELFTVGSKVPVKVLDVKPVQRRMTLSIKQAKQDKLNKEYSSYQTRQGSESVTIGDLLAINNKKEST